MSNNPIDHLDHIGHISESPDFSDFRTQYRHLLAVVKASIQREPGSDITLGKMIDLEQWMIDLKTKLIQEDNTETQEPLTEEQELYISRLFSRKQIGESLNNLLDTCCQRLDTILAKGQTSVEELIKKLNIHHIHCSDRTLVPTGVGEILPGDGSSVDITPQPQVRLTELISLLRENGIFTDDLTLVTGENESSMIRQSTYILVEIPRIGSQVLVCNELSEGTYVNSKWFDREYYFSHTKEQFTEDGLVMVPYNENNPESWKEQIIFLLSLDNETDSGKVDVQRQEALRVEIRGRYTPEEWVKMTAKEKTGVNIAGLGLVAISSVFGVDGNPVNNQLRHLELGLKIFGENNTVIRPQWKKLLSEHEEREKLTNNPELLTETINESYTPEKWIIMTHKEKLGVNIAGLGLTAISSVFGVDGSPEGNNLVHLELGLKIYGEDNSVIRPEWKKLQSEQAEREKLKNNPELLTTKIKRLCTPKKWVKMTVKEKTGVNVAGLGLYAISSVFGVDGNPVNNQLLHLELGLKIFGENNTIIRPQWKKLQSEQAEREKLKNNPELLTTKIKRLCTPEKWVKMTRKEKKNFKISGMGCKAISSAFGVDGSKINNQLVHLVLGLKIFGENNAVILPLWKKLQSEQAEREKLTNNSELLAETIKESYTPEKWVKMNKKEKAGVCVAGLGLAAISSRFAVDGNPVRNKHAHLELGLKIYGEDSSVILPEWKKLQSEHSYR